MKMRQCWSTFQTERDLLSRGMGHMGLSKTSYGMFRGGGKDGERDGFREEQV